MCLCMSMCMCCECDICICIYMPCMCMCNMHVSFLGGGCIPKHVEPCICCMGVFTFFTSVSWVPEPLDLTLTLLLISLTRFPVHGIVLQMASCQYPSHKESGLMLALSAWTTNHWPCRTCSCDHRKHDTRRGRDLTRDPDCSITEPGQLSSAIARPVTPIQNGKSLPSALNFM